jgi:hypothetical protein
MKEVNKLIEIETKDFFLKVVVVLKYKKCRENLMLYLIKNS